MNKEIAVSRWKLFWNFISSFRNKETVRQEGVGKYTNVEAIDRKESERECLRAEMKRELEEMWRQKEAEARERGDVEAIDRKESERECLRAEIQRELDEKRCKEEAIRIEEECQISFSQGKEAIRLKDYMKAYALIHHAAVLGYPPAQLALGDYFSNAFNPISTLSNYYCHACNGTAFATGKCLECGTPQIVDIESPRGVDAFRAPELNFGEACKWYAAAACQLDEARYRLCVARYFGLGLPKHYPTSKKHYDSISAKSNAYVYPPVCASIGFAIALDSKIPATETKLPRNTPKLRLARPAKRKQ